MQDYYGVFPWSTNWCIEENKAWFVLGMQKILCCLDLNAGTCESVIYIPDTFSSTYRFITGCVICDNDIYCIPDNGRNIWIYSKDDCRFTNIEVINPYKLRLEIYDYWKYEGKIFAVSIGLKQIIEINTKEKRIDNYYEICNEDSIARSVKVGEMIYTLSLTSARIYEFNLISKSIVESSLPKVDKIFNTICFNGEEVWLSGFYKEIYVWNKEKNIVRILDHFPKNFGVYNFEEDTDGKVNCTMNPYQLPAFLYTILVDKYIWFVPFQTNQIIYADIKSYQLYEFKIEEEIENKESLLNRINFRSKYSLEYIKDNRYIGLFSFKNNCILEIDTVELKYKWCNYRFDKNCLEQYLKLLNYTLHEGDVFEREIYSKLMLFKKQDKFDKNKRCIGCDIYNETVRNIM